MALLETQKLRDVRSITMSMQDRRAVTPHSRCVEKDHGPEPTPRALNQLHWAAIRRFMKNAGYRVTRHGAAGSSARVAQDLPGDCLLEGEVWRQPCATICCQSEGIGSRSKTSGSIYGRRSGPDSAPGIGPGIRDIISSRWDRLMRLKKEHFLLLGSRCYSRFGTGPRR